MEDLSEPISTLLSASAGVGVLLRARGVPDGGPLAEVSGGLKASPDPNDRG